jgi:surface protein
VKDFSNAFSTNRNEAGATSPGGNTKASTFNGDGLENWNTSSAVTLQSTFDGASAMNSDLSAWDVAKVINLKSAFRRAAAFKARGISTWNLVNNTITSVGLGSFYFTLSIPSCTRWLIVRNWPDSAEMKTLYANWNDYGTGKCASGSQEGKRCDSSSDCAEDKPYPACVSLKSDDGKGKCQVRWIFQFPF